MERYLVLKYVPCRSQKKRQIQPVPLETLCHDSDLSWEDTEEQVASHAWAEAHVEGLGWVGFDISNGISPDER